MQDPLINSDAVSYNITSKNRNLKRALLVAGITIAALAIAVVCVIYFEFHQSSDDSSETVIGPCDVFCTGPVLDAIQMARFYNDSKTYVDLPLKYDPAQVIQDFNNLPSYDNATLKKFLDSDYYDDPNAPDLDVIPWTPSDYDSNPSFLNNITSPVYRTWAQQVVGIWLTLGKQINQSALENPQRRTLLHLEHPYMMVPGGRFREFYYWDTFWIIRGLLVSNMTQTTKMILDNFLATVNEYGFFPNGARIYYLTRSQPPFLTLMLDAYYQATGDAKYVAQALPILDIEYTFWMELGKHAVKVGDFVANRYYSDTDEPRPESYYEDKQTAAGLNDSAASTLYNHIAAAAESGWDFSSRWFDDGVNLTTCVTMNIIPADLNAIMYKVEATLYRLYTQLYPENTNKQKFYSQAMANRKNLLDKLLFDTTTNQWRDYNFVKQAFTNSSAISNYIPLWANYTAHSTDDIITSLNSSGLVLPGGLTSTLSETGQQWDYPNAWAPLQHMIIEGLIFVNTTRSNNLAMSIATNWLNSNYLAFNQTSLMYEKYNATAPGVVGQGGEYTLQTGFGWTNGVVLSLLDSFPHLQPPQ